MDLIQHTLEWSRGEIVAGALVTIFGIITLTAAVFFQKLGTSPVTKALFLPLLIVGLFYTIAGPWSMVHTGKQMQPHHQAWEQDAEQFALDEQARVEGFGRIFRISIPLGVVFVVGGVLLFFLVRRGPYPKAIGIALALLGLSVLVIDCLAMARADRYQECIEEAVERTTGS